MKKEDILGVSIVTEDKESIIKILQSFIQNGKKGQILACANPHSIIESMEDMEFREALNSADILLPDGIGVVLASKILGGNIKKRISGPDIFSELTGVVNQNKGCKYFFYGSTDETLRKIELRIKKDFPDIKIAGLYSPPFREISEEENDRHVEIINKSEADVLWVGMTAPKQEKWIYKNKDKLEVPLVGAIGAAFDFFARTKKRVPKLMRDMGFEWLFRFLMEPNRLWERNLISTPLFLLAVFKEKMRRKLF